jgi:hypothetical protein
MSTTRSTWVKSAIVVVLGAAAPGMATDSVGQTIPGWGRISFMGQFGQQHPTNGAGTQNQQYDLSIGLRSAQSEDGGLEYSLDTRASNYSFGQQQQQRVSIYDAYVGMRTRSGWGVKVGQVWLNELGGLGSLGGAHVEYRQPLKTDAGRYRAGLFFGAEPKAFEAGFVDGVKKAGAYVAFDGTGARRHVLGYVTIRNQGLVERSTVTMTNFVPLGSNKFFLYQTAEYDLQNAGGGKTSGLNYVFATVRYAPIRALEFQANYHHGLSVDSRSITNDQLNGRPVNPALLQGFLFESAGGRVTVEVVKGVRLWLGYAQDRNSREQAPQQRSSAGLYASNLFKSGFDIAASATHNNRGEAGGYDSTYFSVGRSLGQRVYVSADYTTSLSVLRTTGSGGLIVETRPETARYSVMSSINLSRSFSLMLSLERLTDQDTTDDRGVMGITYRF